MNMYTYIYRLPYGDVRTGVLPCSADSVLQKLLYHRMVAGMLIAQPVQLHILPVPLLFIPFSSAGEAVPADTFSEIAWPWI